jgi:putative acetyltransferase
VFGRQAEVVLNPGPGAQPAGLPPFLIRPERAGDEPAIDALTQGAFREHPLSRHTETLTLAILRRTGALAVSLVAEAGGAIRGHVAFSAVTVSGGADGWFALGPLAVAGSHRNQGIGGALVGQGLRTLRERAASGCVVLGDPVYFHRFGFRSTPALRLEGAPPGCFLVRPFRRAVPLGSVRYHVAFDATLPVT